MATIFDHNLNKDIPLDGSRVSGKSVMYSKVKYILLRKTSRQLSWVMALIILLLFNNLKKNIFRNSMKCMTTNKNAKRGYKKVISNLDESSLGKSLIFIFYRFK
jgi:uncharacterized protein (DUF924 family)